MVIGGVFIIIGVMIFSHLLHDAPAAATADSLNVSDEGEGITDVLDFDESLSEEEESDLDSIQTTSHEQTIIEVVTSFIRDSFSANSALGDLNLIDVGSTRFKEYMKNRQHLINLRRESFSYSKRIDSFQLQVHDVDIRDDCAIVLGVSRESYSYSDSPDHHAASFVEYLAILSNTHSGWKIYWATSNDAYSKMLEEQAGYCRVRGLIVPYSVGDDLYSDLRQIKDYSSETIFQKCNQFVYAEFNMVRDNELENIEGELGELRDNVTSTQSTGDFSRFAMRSYQNNWALSRNPAWQDYSPPYGGGDCQNYVSQIIKAGGAPFDDSGSHKWYWYSDSQRTASWTGVNSMQNYIRYNSGLGPNGIFGPSASSLLTGDMVHIDWDNDGSYNHAVAIYNPGSSPTISGHTEDCINKKLSDYPGAKQYIHFTHYGN